MNETSWSWKQYVQRTHKIGVNLNDFEAKLTASLRSQRNLNYTQSFTENKNDSRHTWQTINEVTSRPTSRPFKAHNNWMEKCTTSQSRRAWWIWKVRNILEAFFHKRSLFFHTWQKLLSTHCWRQNFRSWVHQRGNSLHLHAPVQNLEGTKTDHVPSQNYSQHFTYPI